MPGLLPEERVRELPPSVVELAERQLVGEAWYGVRDQKEYMNWVKERGEWEALH